MRTHSHKRKKGQMHRNLAPKINFLSIRTIIHELRRSNPYPRSTRSAVLRTQKRNLLSRTASPSFPKEQNACAAPMPRCACNILFLPLCSEIRVWVRESRRISNSVFKFLDLCPCVCLSIYLFVYLCINVDLSRCRLFWYVVYSL